MGRGQTDIVSAVLLMGIIVGLIVVAYFWGVPLVKKQQDTVRVGEMDRFMRLLHQDIKSVAKGGGREIIRGISIPGDVFLDTGSNRITLTSQTSFTVIEPGDDIILVGDDNKTSSPLGSEPAFLSVRSERLDRSNYGITMRLVYRNLTTSTDVFMLRLGSVGRPTIGAGAGHVITIEDGGSRVIKQGGDGGRDLHINDILVRMD